MLIDSRHSQLEQIDDPIEVDKLESDSQIPTKSRRSGGRSPLKGKTDVCTYNRGRCGVPLTAGEKKAGFVRCEKHRMRGAAGSRNHRDNKASHS